ncbi:hypothetical protein [Cognatishimia maritima]|uniref:Alpha 1,4-glycosyltransferase conserved region n=1 Tax=Cognatishimia maritima TaxID=870908 RepID=A0A1M5T6U6_9RHOB|nr:hypothetical protein [Cognatishimia maritima]SHH46330.1 hypothetical protein SAMN04488044_2596 [Cognatishimia maritima]
MAHNPEIASLWIGGELTWLEQLCLKSFADHGHKITLYSYDPISNIPPGVASGDANEIFQADEIHRHAVTGSPAIHADIWRLNLLRKTDKIWVDADVLCHHPFGFDTPFVFGWEKDDLVCNAVLGLPSESKALAGLNDFFEDPYAIGPWLRPKQIAHLEKQRDAGKPVHMTEQEWGFTGPAAVTWFLQKTGEIEYAKPQEVFFPVSYKRRNHLILSRFAPEDRFTSETRAVHLWARRLKARALELPGRKPRRGSFLDRMLQQHEIVPEDAPLPDRRIRLAGDSKDPRFRAMLAIEALKGDASIRQLATDNNVEPKDIRKWRAKLVSDAAIIFEQDSTR